MAEVEGLQGRIAKLEAEVEELKCQRDDTKVFVEKLVDEFGNYVTDKAVIVKAAMKRLVRLR